MYLAAALEKAQTITDLEDLFAPQVLVELCTTTDAVRVFGYSGSVSTDQIAFKVCSVAHNLNLRAPTEESERLADTLAGKVFLPLKELVEDPENSCSLWSCSLYPLFALARIGWTPPPHAIFGNSIALKHAEALANLSDKYEARG